MKWSNIVNLRNRELTAVSNVLWKKRLELSAALRYMLIHEYLFDHPLVNDIYLYMRDKVCNDPICLNILYCCWSNSKDNEETSIVWLATNYALKMNDEYLIDTCDDIKMYSL